MMIRAIKSMMGCVFVAALAGCAANAEPTPSTSTESVAQNTQAVTKTPERIWTQVGLNPYGEMELDVTTCSNLHQEWQMQGGQEMCPPEDVIESARVWVLDSHFRPKDFIEEHAPSGGCIHLDLASAVPGDFVILQANVKFAADKGVDVRTAFLSVK